MSTAEQSSTDPNNPPSDARPKSVRSWPHARVLRFIREQEGSLNAMARRLGRNPGHLSRVARGDEPSTPVAAEICRTLSLALNREVRPCEVWPKLYAEDGGPKSTAYRRLPKAS